MNNEPYQSEGGGSKIWRAFGFATWLGDHSLYTCSGTMLYAVLSPAVMSPDAITLIPTSRVRPAEIQALIDAGLENVGVALGSQVRRSNQGAPGVALASLAIH